MTNPFDDEDGNFIILANEGGRHSLWPASIPVPSGWSIAFGPRERATCLNYVSKTWTQLRPAPASDPA
ncbi:MbtH family protein [Dactylosporangium sp. NPDC049525]|uniref:MbtH family protein n=1 Tax=Dactylosporangium sp. NPDC049525 TaxID=3154730 RepID=UPI003416839E